MKNLQGRVFGQWVVKCRGYRTSTQYTWLCICTCGTLNYVATSDLCSGKSTKCRSCATKHRNATHGVSGHPAYKHWKNMMRRCSSNYKQRKDYYDRGITVCREWLSASAFVADMGAPPSGHSLERLDNDAGYSKNNCVWATRSQQMRNRRNSVFVIYGGALTPLKTACESAGVSYNRVKDAGKPSAGGSYQAAFDKALTQL